MHLAVSGLVSRQMHFRNTDMFMLGSLLPDVSVSGNGHWKVLINDGKQITYDLSGFRSSFSDKLFDEGLLSGYYLHLVQDMLFRKYVIEELGWNYSKENVRELREDYSSLNAYLVKKYKIGNISLLNAWREKNTIISFSDYDVERLAGEVQADLSAEQSGRRAVFLSPEEADSYIRRAIDCCVREMDSLYSGKSTLNEYALAWRNPFGS